MALHEINSTRPVWTRGKPILIDVQASPEAGHVEVIGNRGDKPLTFVFQNLTARTEEETVTIRPGKTQGFHVPAGQHAVLGVVYEDGKIEDVDLEHVNPDFRLSVVAVHSGPFYPHQRAVDLYTASGERAWLENILEESGFNTGWRANTGPDQITINASPDIIGSSFPRFIKKLYEKKAVDREEARGILMDYLEMTGKVLRNERGYLALYDMKDRALWDAAWNESGNAINALYAGDPAPDKAQRRVTFDV